MTVGREVGAGAGGVVCFCFKNKHLVLFALIVVAQTWGLNIANAMEIHGKAERIRPIHCSYCEIPHLRKHYSVG